MESVQIWGCAPAYETRFSPSGDCMGRSPGVGYTGWHKSPFGGDDGRDDRLPIPLMR